ncbi:MAG TPA: SUF system NifU family Fe-S cluster assembly protein [Gammaproteobacteria bacterium]|nr:SUF system NifU family Fe-S cluster assembly protein [Gammaproteobacteria bacterium]
MNDLQDLYREVILDHNRRPRNFGELADADRVIEGVNPLCGDKLTLYLKIADGKVRDVKFKGSGCAISVASSSLMTERVKGATIEASLALFDKVHDLLTGAAAASPEELDKLVALAGVREYPTRVKCASLGWHALKAALDHGGAKVSTE